jgi:exonuclease VII small subunit
MPEAPPRRAVYTALTGSHEDLLEQPLAATTDVPFICFTDDPELTSDSWQIRLVSPILPMDPIRSARALKIQGYPDLSSYDETLWIDARVVLTADPAVILDDWLDGSDLAAPRHSFRKDVVAEFEEILLRGLDESSRLYEQLNHYSVTAPDQLQAPVPWTGMLARRHTPDVQRAMEAWLLHVVRYSRRDQLSFVHTVAAAGVEWRSIPIDNFHSDVHDWPAGTNRSARAPIFAVSESLQAPVARVGELQRDLEQTFARMSAAVQAREQRIADLEAAVTRYAAANAAKRERLQRARRTIRRLREEKARSERGLARRAAGRLRRAVRPRKPPTESR